MQTTTRGEDGRLEPRNDGFPPVLSPAARRHAEADGRDTSSGLRVVIVVDSYGAMRGDAQAAGITAMTSSPRSAHRCSPSRAGTVFSVGSTRSTGRGFGCTTTTAGCTATRACQRLAARREQGGRERRRRARFRRQCGDAQGTPTTYTSKYIGPTARARLQQRGQPDQIPGRMATAAGHALRCGHRLDAVGTAPQREGGAILLAEQRHLVGERSRPCVTAARDRADRDRGRRRAARPDDAATASGPFAPSWSRSRFRCRRRRRT